LYDWHEHNENSIIMHPDIINTHPMKSSMLYIFFIILEQETNSSPFGVGWRNATY